MPSSGPAFNPTGSSDASIFGAAELIEATLDGLPPPDEKLTYTDPARLATTEDSLEGVMTHSEVHDDTLHER